VIDPSAAPPAGPAPPALTAMTFNVRYDEESDGRHRWRHRRPLVLETIRSHQPHLLGLQEPTAGQWLDLAAALPGHTPFGAGGEDRDDVEPHGGFFRTARFEPLDTGMFWLSDTPSVPHSISWPNDWGARACGWVKLRDRMADRDLLFASTHLDTNAGAWMPSAAVLHAEIDRVAGDLPIVLVGDFNCHAGSPPHRYLQEVAGYRDAWHEAGHADDGVITFNGFTQLTRLPDDAEKRREWLPAPAIPLDALPDRAAPGLPGDNYRIDWILVRGAIVAVSAVIDCRSSGGLLPSDHYPVVAQLEYRTPPRA
jgi:endonuclease/exonuclease/phosphatase family metal-dependent hydrolase